MQLAALISAALLVAFEIRHFFRHGDIYAASSSLAEVGCHLVAALGFVFALHRLHARRPSPVFDVGALVATAIAGFLAFAALEPFNPLFNCKEEPGLLLNPLALAYGLPALLFGALYFKTRGARPVAYRNAVGVLALMLSFAYASLQALRLMRAFDAPALCGPIGQFEQWALSALWLAIGVGLLLAGVLRRSLGLRAASACYVLAAVCKAFLYDLSGLSGLPRALSFIVLGLVLIGIGLIYQKLLFARPAGADSAEDIKE
jgi:uncharacterized membrane protein